MTFHRNGKISGGSAKTRRAHDCGHQNHFAVKIAYYRNGAQPGVLVNFKEYQTPQKAEEIADVWRRTLRGVDNFFRTHFISYPADITSLDIPDITQPMEVSIQDSKSILKGYRVPPEMIGDTTDNPYQFSPEKRYGFMLGVIQPILDKFLWGINQQFMPQVAERGHILVADYSAFGSWMPHAEGPLPELMQRL
jgi:hypothetical protein